jgi:hypothetical protein
MHVSGPVEAATEPATETATARHGAQDVAPDASGFGALLLVLLPPTPTVPPPTGFVAPGGQRPGGDAVVAANPSSVPATIAIERVIAGGRADIAGAGPAVAPRAAPPDASPQSAPNLMPATAPGRAVATDASPVLPGAVREVARDGGEEVAEDAAPAVRAVSAPPTALTDATAPRPPRLEPHGASTRSRDGHDVSPSFDGAGAHQPRPAISAHPSMIDDRDQLVMASAAPAERHEHPRNGELDAGLIARATSAATRIDAPQALSSPPSVEAPRPVAPPELAEQLVRTARVALRDGVAEMDIQLTPPSLGVVRVTAAAAHDGLGLTLSAERPETRALLLHAIPEMQAALANQGITTTTIAVAPAFDPPGERRAPTRRDPDRPARPARDAIAERARLAPRSAVGAVDLTV